MSSFTERFTALRQAVEAFNKGHISALPKYYVLRNQAIGLEEAFNEVKPKKEPKDESKRTKAPKRASSGIPSDNPGEQSPADSQGSRQTGPERTQSAEGSIGTEETQESLQTPFGAVWQQIELDLTNPKENDNA